VPVGGDAQSLLSFPPSLPPSLLAYPGVASAVVDQRRDVGHLGEVLAETGNLGRQGRREVGRGGVRGEFWGKV